MPLSPRTWLAGLCALACVILSSGDCHAQHAVLSSGTTISDVGGSVSFSLGQVAFTTITDAGGSMSQGVQQTEQACIGDLNNDGTISTPDLLVLIGDYGCLAACTADLNGDNVVNTNDLLFLIGLFGTACLP